MTSDEEPDGRPRSRTAVGSSWPGALRQLLGVRLEVPPDSIELAYGAAGKPGLAAAVPRLGRAVHVSHCDDVAAFAFAVDEISESTSRPCGASRRRQHAKLAFSPRRTRPTGHWPRMIKPLGFFNCWTRGKLCQSGRRRPRLPLDRFEVSLTPGEPARCSGAERAWERLELGAARLRPGPGLIGAVAVQTGGAPGRGSTAGRTNLGGGLPIESWRRNENERIQGRLTPHR